MEDPYQVIADEAIRKAERVGGSLESFKEGLDTIRLAIVERRELVIGEMVEQERAERRRR